MSEYIVSQVFIANDVARYQGTCHTIVLCRCFSEVGELRASRCCHVSFLFFLCLFFSWWERYHAAGRIEGIYLANSYGICTGNQRTLSRVFVTRGPYGGLSDAAKAIRQNARFLLRLQAE